MRGKLIIFAIVGAAGLIAAAIYFMGAGNRPPTFIATDPVVLPRNDSILHTTVHVGMDWLNGEIGKSIPNPLAEENDQRIATAVNIAGSLQVTRLVDKVFEEERERQACSNIAKWTGICLAYKTLRETVRVTRKVEEVVTEQVTRVADVDATVDYKVWPTATAISLEGSRISAVVEAEFRVRLNAELSGAAGDLTNLHITGLTSCGHGEAPAKLRGTVVGQVSVAPSGTALTFKPETWKIDWLRPCEITAAKIELEDLLKISFLRKELEDAVNDALAEVSGEHDLKAELASAWADIEPPIHISRSPEMWLSINPQSMYVTNLRGNEKELLVDVSLRSRPEISVGPQPPIEKKPFLSEPVIGEPGAIFHVESAISYKDVGHIISRELSKKPIKNVVLEEIWAASDGRKLFVGARVTHPVRGHIQLFGTPTWRMAGQQLDLTIPDLDFSATADNAFLNGLPVLTRSAIRSKLRDVSSFPLTAEKAKAIAAATDSPLEFKGETKGFVTLSNSSITPEQIILERDRIRVPLIVKTDLQVTVGREPAAPAVAALSP